MPDFIYPYGTTRVQSLGSSGSTGTTLTGSGTIGTPGSWVSLGTSSFDASLLMVHLIGGTSNTGDFFVDIGFGSGTPTEVISRLMCSIGKTQTGNSYSLPLFVPAGTVIQARVRQNLNAAVTFLCHVTLVGGTYGPPSGSILRTYGFTDGTCTAITIDPGGTANTKGAWVQVVAATDAPIYQLLMGIGNKDNLNQSGNFFLFDIGIGASGSEIVIVPDLPSAQNVQGDTLGPNNFGPFNVYIPAGTRLAVRSSCSITDATDRLAQVLLYGAG